MSVRGAALVTFSLTLAAGCLGPGELRSPPCARSAEALLADNCAPCLGLRIPDHTQYTREVVGQDKWSQSYAVELDVNSDRWTVAASGMAGDLLLHPPELQGRGLAVSVTPGQRVRESTPRGTRVRHGRALRPRSQGTARRRRTGGRGQLHSAWMVRA
ncbi:MAG: hypothetical protein HY698_14300 [Deltaproteobacteria bacterium]|nr:hypothetical protein [Deltaproteobacteria bacterium]